MDNQAYRNAIIQHMTELSSKEKAQSSARYFPEGIHCIGVTASDITNIIKAFQSQFPELDAELTLVLVEYLLKHRDYHEEVMIAFGLLNRFIKKSYDDSLMDRFEYWLEHYTNNWAQVDDLCIKTIYQFFLARPYLIKTTQHWAHSKVSWCRRASNVVWVKFIKRKIGKAEYHLDPKLVFENCNTLLHDHDEFVQKSIGWLLKVTATHHEKAVVEYLSKNGSLMPRLTIRYAIEKLDKSTRDEILKRTKSSD